MTVRPLYLCVCSSLETGGERRGDQGENGRSLLLTSHNEVGVGEGILCLHEGLGMATVEEVEHSIRVDPHGLWQREVGLQPPPRSGVQTLSSVQTCCASSRLLYGELSSLAHWARSVGIGERWTARCQARLGKTTKSTRVPSARGD